MPPEPLTMRANICARFDNVETVTFYDRMGNRTSVVEADGSRVTWTYDATYQLTGEHRTGSHPYEDSYSYDAAGNRLLKIHDGARTTYSYDAANQLQWSEDASGRTTYTFDADGNQTGVEKPNGDRTTTSWDFENRTTLVQDASGIRNTMTYAPDGLRVKLEESTGTKKFVWDGQKYLAETDENDDTQVVYTTTPHGRAPLISQRRSTDTEWYHFDALRSTRSLTDSLESIVATFLYSSFGVAVSEYDVTNAAFRYLGQLQFYNDAEASSLYRHGRLYLPHTGRWESARRPHTRQHARPYVLLHNSPTSAAILLGYAQQGEPTAAPSEADDALNDEEFAWTITITPVHEILDALKCGQSATIHWRYTLRPIAPCEGYFVQKVTVECLIYDCPDCPSDEDEREMITFYEAWDVPDEGVSNSPDLIFPSPITGMSYKYTDIGQGKAIENTCGGGRATREVRFYCKDDNTREIDSWITDLVYGDEDSHCRIGPGDLRSTGPDAPGFWKDEVGGRGYATPVESEFSSVWNCCICQNNYFLADAKPRIEMGEPDDVPPP